MIDIIGRKFGEVIVEKEVDSPNRFRYFLVRHTDSGNTNVVRMDQLLQGRYTGKTLRSHVPEEVRAIYGRIKEDSDWETPQEFYKWITSAGYPDLKYIKKLDKKKPHSSTNSYLEKKRGINYTVAGETKNLTEWAEVLGISRERVRQLLIEGKLEKKILGS